MGWPGTGMLTRGLGIPGRGEAWLGALPINEAPALGVLNLATKSGRGGTTGRAAGWPASGRAPEDTPGAGGGAGAAWDSPSPVEAGARETSGRWRGPIAGRGGAGAAGRKAPAGPAGLPVGNG